MPDTNDSDQVDMLALPPEYSRAPEWARALAKEQRNTRDHHDKALQRLERAQELTSQALGCEPDADGNHGRGLIGDVRKMHKDLDALMGLRLMGVGFVAAVSIFGALILLGVTHWFQSLVEKT